MSFAGVSSAEIILDSGADTSALPLTYADVGGSCQHETVGQDFIDAQGGKLDIRDTRLATVDLGNGVILRERFIIANISCPLLALGHILRAGWEIQHFSDGVFLVKNGKFVNVSFKRNSLCVKGSIRMISEDDCLSPTSTAPGPKAVRAIHLQPVLRRLLPGWNKVNPQVFALTTRRARLGVLEFGESISELEDLEGEIYDPESVVEVLTLAHAHNVASEQLGFTLVAGEQAPYFVVGKAGDDDTGEQEQAPQPVQEAPAELPDAEPLDEEHIVPFTDESTVTVDGVVLSCDNTLKALRAGCEVLGLSKRGSKKDCMRRMLEFVKARGLMEAHAVEATLKKDSERVAIPQKKPVEPTDGEQDPIFNDEGLEEAIAAAKRASKAQSMNVDVERSGLQVLQEDNLPHDAKSLSTRFARTWKEKDKQGNAIWLRRSRLVAREHTWLQPDREALFSPATSNIASRILPICFLALREHQDTMMLAIDVKDAFLTVKQEQPTRVRCTDASGKSVSYSLGRVLPGQRDGNLLWHRDLVKFVGESCLGMEEFEAYPSILRSKLGDCLLMIHVDDLLVVGSCKVVTEQLIPHMQSRYDVSIEIMSNVGEELTFLKRTHQLLESGRMVVKIHGKHLDQLCKLLQLSKRLQNKKSPGHSEIEIPDKTEEIPTLICPSDCFASNQLMGTNANHIVIGFILC
ncbi:unnamed protein product [Cladocopium goreaui]|uniref:Peptidase A2 domain-containing protein n=1 Tax=Cladocopium goreaui TaxID=2562237 RepID=A0A9P1DVQ1_9DINO|nr:unnamed protein product [Cladocopium goreaui]